MAKAKRGHNVGGGVKNAARDRAIQLLIDTSDALRDAGQGRANEHNEWIRACDAAYKKATTVKAEETGESVSELSRLHTLLDRKRDNLVRLGAGKRIRHEVEEKTVDLLREARATHGALKPLDLPDPDDFAAKVLAEADAAVLEEGAAPLDDLNLDDLDGVE